MASSGASGGRRVRSFVAIALSAIAGLGHVYLRRYVQGVLTFALFALAANGVLLGSLWQGGEARTILLASKGLLVAVWVAALASVLRLTVFTDREKLRERREEKVREGLAHYLRADSAAALASLEAASECDVDRDDVDLLFYLGAVHARLGNRRKAAKLLRRAVAWDRTRKWRLEVDRELARLEGKEPARAPRRAPPPPEPAASVEPA